MEQKRQAKIFKETGEAPPPEELDEKKLAKKKKRQEEKLLPIRARPKTRIERIMEGDPYKEFEKEKGAIKKIVRNSKIIDEFIELVPAKGYFKGQVAPYTTATHSDIFVLASNMERIKEEHAKQEEQEFMSLENLERVVKNKHIEVYPIAEKGLNQILKRIPMENKAERKRVKYLKKVLHKRIRRQEKHREQEEFQKYLKDQKEREQTNPEIFLVKKAQRRHVKLKLGTFKRMKPKEETGPKDIDEMELDFGNFVFNDKPVPSYVKEKAKKEKPSDKELLKQAKKKKEMKEEAKTSEEAKEKVIKDEWKNAMDRASGVKVKDDPLLLEKTIKKKSKKKEKSAREWQERLEKQKQAEEDKQKKRKENIREKKEKKKETKLKKIKKKKGLE